MQFFSQRERVRDTISRLDHRRRRRRRDRRRHLCHAA